MAEHPFIEAARRRGEDLSRGRDKWSGNPRYFMHLGKKRETAFPWLSDEDMAGEVRMLMRNDPAHELIVCAARDRILHLSQLLTDLLMAAKITHQAVGDRRIEGMDQNQRGWRDLLGSAIRKAEEARK